MKNSIFKNSTLFLATQAFVKIVSFLYTLFLVKSLAVNDFGQYIVALSYFSLISILADFGLGNYLIREISSGHRKINEVVPSIIVIRITIIIIILILFVGILYRLDPDIHRRSVSLLALLAVLPQSLALTLDAIFVALLKVKYSALSLIILSLSTTFAGLFFVSRDLGSYGAVFGLLIGQTVYASVLSLLFVKQQIRLAIFPQFMVLKQVIKDSFPYALLGILGLLYFKIDSLLLSYLKGAYEIGIYGAAYKFLEAIIFIPSAVSMALFPILSKSTDDNLRQAYKLYIRTSFIMLVLSLILMMAYLLILPIFIRTFLPKYQAATEVVQILSLTIPFFFLITPQSALLMSQKIFLNKLIIVSIFNLLLNVVMNILLIPHYSYYGAAWVTVISDVIGFIIFFVIIYRYFSKARKSESL